MIEIMTRKKVLICILALISLLIFETYIIIKQNSRIKWIEENLPVLLKGEAIKYFELIDSDNNRIDSSVLKKKKYNMIFIFDRSCSPCTQNIVYWKKIKKFMGNRIPIYGIALSDHKNMVNFAKEGRINFDLYFPVDRDRFIEKFRLKLDLSQTIVLERNKVLYVYRGNLNTENFSYILTQLKKLLNIRDE